MESTPDKLDDKGNELAIELYSPFAKPHTREWRFPLATVYALIKPTPDDKSSLTIVLRWAAQFAPRSPKDGLIWMDFPMPDEAAARVSLAECGYEDANYYYERFVKSNDLPAMW